MAGEDHEHEAEHGDRVGHGRLDLLAQLDLLLDGVGQLEQHRVEHAAGLAGSHHGDVEAVERLRVAGQRLREGRPLLDVGPHLVDDLGQDLLFSVCSARMLSARSSESPELIMVANWRLKTATSFIFALRSEARDLESFFRPDAFLSMARGT